MNRLIIIALATLSILSIAGAQAAPMVAASAAVRAVPASRATPPTAPTQNRHRKFFFALPITTRDSDPPPDLFGTTAISGRERSTDKNGEFFRKALISFNTRARCARTAWSINGCSNQVPVTFTSYTIKGDDLAYVGNLPTAHEEQAKLKFLPTPRCLSRRGALPLGRSFHSKS